MKHLVISIPEKKKEYTITVDKNILFRLPELVSLEQYSKIVVITDDNVKNVLLANILDAISPKPYSIVLPSGEKNKTIQSVEVIWKEMHEIGCDRKSLIINLGGGVIGDMGGFAASTYMRGIDFLQIPTTLLAAVDASIGGKTGIDFTNIKNLIGTFQQPIGVIIDVSVLRTLPDREVISGFAEVIKHGLIADKTYFEEVTTKKPKEFSEDELIQIITRSCEIKASIVAGDEKEQGKRKLVNFGHTVGHAVESLSWHTDTPLLHGEAIAIGMIAEAEISKRVGLLTADEVFIIKHALKEAGLPIKMKQLSVHNIMEKIVSDKKNISGKIQWVLLRHIGEAVYNREVEQGIVVQSLENLIM